MGYPVLSASASEELLKRCVMVGERSFIGRVFFFFFFNASTLEDCEIDSGSRTVPRLAANSSRGCGRPPEFLTRLILGSPGLSCRCCNFTLNLNSFAGLE